MKENKEQELTEQDMQQVSGGVVIGGYGGGHQHVKGARTGQEREDSRWIFATQHQYEYVCKECGKKFWVDEERD